MMSRSGCVVELSDGGCGLRERSPYSDYADIALIGDCAVLFAKRAIELYMRPSFLNIYCLQMHCLRRKITDNLIWCFHIILCKYRLNIVTTAVGIDYGFACALH